MKFQTDTIADLKARLDRLKEQRDRDEEDLGFHTQRATDLSAKVRKANAAIADYTLLLGYAEDRTTQPGKPGVIRLLASLTPAQRKGNACLICATDITIDEPDQLSAEVNGMQLFIHVDPKVCTRELEKQLSEEVPF